MMNREEVEAFLISAQDLSGRALWEGMQEVFDSAPRHLDLLRDNLSQLLAVADKHSVIARDHLVRILALMMERDDDVRSAYLSILRTAPDNQFPMYAELGAPVISVDTDEFEEILIERFDHLSEPKRRRISAVLNNLR